MLEWLNVNLQSVYSKEKKKWQQNFVLHARHKSLDGKTNIGNFLELVKLLAVFDSIWNSIWIIYVKSHPRLQEPLHTCHKQEFLHLIVKIVREKDYAIYVKQFFSAAILKSPDRQRREIVFGSHSICKY